MDSVVLRSELWDRLVGIAGSSPSWVHGCALGGDHEDSHHTPVGYRGGHLWWLRWIEGGEAELTALKPCPDTDCMLFDGHDGAHRGHDPVPVRVPAGRHSRTPAPTATAESSVPRAAASPNGLGPGAAPASPSAAQTETQAQTPRPSHRADADGDGGKDSAGEIARALWALTAAVDRLADARTGGPHTDRDRRGREGLGGL